MSIWLHYRLRKVRMRGALLTLVTIAQDVR